MEKRHGPPQTKMNTIKGEEHVLVGKRTRSHHLYHNARAWRPVRVNPPENAADDDDDDDGLHAVVVVEAAVVVDNDGGEGDVVVAENANCIPCKEDPCTVEVSIRSCCCCWCYCCLDKVLRLVDNGHVRDRHLAGGTKGAAAAVVVVVDL